MRAVSRRTVPQGFSVSVKGSPEVYRDAESAAPPGVPEAHPGLDDLLALDDRSPVDRATGFRETSSLDGAERARQGLASKRIDSRRGAGTLPLSRRFDGQRRLAAGRCF